MERAAAAPAPESSMPVKTPELAKAYLTQPTPSPAVPRELVLIVTEVVLAPVLVMPVTVWDVDEVAKLRSVLLLRLRVAPVVAPRMKTDVPTPVVEVRVPALDRLPPDRV